MTVNDEHCVGPPNLSSALCMPSQHTKARHLSGWQEIDCDGEKALSHSIRPPPARRRPLASVSPLHKPARLAHHLFFILLMLCCSIVSASEWHDANTLRQSEVERLVRRGEILVDRRTPPHAVQLIRRQDAIDPSAPQQASASETESASASATPTMTESSGSSENLATDPDAPADAPLPRPFDAGLGSNYTSDSCPAFIRKFLASSEFQKCLPLSLLLQNSNSFFKAEKSITRITQVLDSICDADFNSCSALMSSLAEGLRQEENCAADYEAENSLVIQAYNGLVSFDSLFQAGCLRSSSGSYCFADAITNFSSPSDSYIYFIPLGVPLPGASRPSCNECLKKSMSFFSNFASNASEPVSTTYVPSAQQLNVGCGPTFVNASVPVATSGAALPPFNSGARGLPTLFALAVVLLSAWLS